MSCATLAFLYINGFTIIRQASPLADTIGLVLTSYLAKAIEFMVIDALLAAEPYLRIANYVEKPDRYVFLTDNLLNKIEESNEKV